MSFINNLFKGFVRSAVNQVGRDGGKVISNKVYGDKHSKPIRIVDNSHSQSQAHKVSRENLVSRGDVESEGLFPESVNISIVKVIFSFLFTFIFPIVGPIYWIYKSIKSFSKRSVRFYSIERIGIYKEDKRFKTGRRLEGYRDVKSKTNVTAEATDKELKTLKINAIIYLVLACIVGYVQYDWIMNSDLSGDDDLIPKEKVELGLINSNSGLNMRYDSTTTGDIINSIPNQDTVKIINKGAAWHYVEYNNEKGYVSSSYIDIIQN
ncbi:SH3 domain-containing protein [Marivirga harenae]|uniref:SH3 domain-containing protein n=1 Tax=Marivirga harenae TaxID=2010992 RepID=UPI0026DFA47E|nr:SH3 domain-containing protein [Marivirga harenae]WKV11464.1 SH3 domain-containing protein [Marivirga harenae]